jgi:hypothetical protein
VFSNPLPSQNPLCVRPGCAALAQYMTRAWVSFAHNLDPNHTGRAYTLARPPLRGLT